MPERDLDALVALRDHALAFLSLENAMSRARADRRSTDFGEVAWATVLDDDDLAEFRAEFADGLASALAERSVARLDKTIHAWRLTSDLLRDPEAMARVNTGVDEDDVEVSSPTEIANEPAVCSGHPLGHTTHTRKAGPMCTTTRSLAQVASTTSSTPTTQAEPKATSTPS